MREEIGSNFWEYDLSVQREERFWWENEEYNYTFTKSGRNSLKAICDMLKESCKVHEVLLPEYLCETEIDPWREGGWDVKFYVVNRDFSINIESLREMAGHNHPAAILIQRYYGFDTISGEVEEYLKKLQGDGVVLIEDLTQTLFSGCRTEFCDYYTSSLRKFFAIPDGGVLISKKDIRFANPVRNHIPIDETSQKAFDLKTEYFRTMNPETKSEFRSIYEVLFDQIAVNDKVYVMSELSQNIFETFDYKFVSEQRKSNYDLLAGLLGDISEIKLLLPEKCGDCVPLYMTIYMESEEDREACRKYLAGKDIYCPIIWPKPEYYEIGNAETLYIYDHVMSIPIDQRYDADDMKRISQEMHNWFNR